MSVVYRRIGIIFAFLNINNTHGISLPVSVNSIEGLFSTVESNYFSKTSGRRHVFVSETESSDPLETRLSGKEKLKCPK